MSSDKPDFRAAYRTALETFRVKKRRERLFDAGDIGRTLDVVVGTPSDRRAANVYVRRRLRRRGEAFDRFVTRSGSFLPPVSRFHSSKVCAEILPSTSS